MIPLHAFGAGITRRGFVRGIAAAGVLTAVPWTLRPTWAAPREAVLTGTDFALEIGTVPMNITGRPMTGTGVNGSVPAPILRWREGDTVTLAVTNRLAAPSSIHWHGIRTPSPMDGVPGLSFAGIPPGETYVYRFLVHQSGTYWYHSHSEFQEQTGVYGAIVIEPKGGYVQRFDHDYLASEHLLAGLLREGSGEIVRVFREQEIVQRRPDIADVQPPSRRWRELRKRVFCLCRSTCRRSAEGAVGKETP